MAEWIVDDEQPGAVGLAANHLRTFACHVDRGAVGIKASADERDEGVELGLPQVESRHPVAVDAGRDDLTEIIVGQRPTEPAQPEIHAVDVVAEHSVAQPALGCIESGARVDVGPAVRVISDALGQAGPGGGQKQYEGARPPEGESDD